MSDFYKKDKIDTASCEFLQNYKYWAPEQGAEGEDHRIDIFSLGLIFHELLTGILPRGTGHLISAVNNNFDFLFDQIIEKMTRQDRDMRFKSMGDVKAALNFYFDTYLPRKSKPLFGGDVELTIDGVETNSLEMSTLGFGDGIPFRGMISDSSFNGISSRTIAESIYSRRIEYCRNKTYLF